MFSKILAMLVILINQRIRDARVSLETEEKNREIATLQGSIRGWRKLLDLLKEFLDPSIEIVSDDTVAVPIESIETQEIEELQAEMEMLTATQEWENLLKKVLENKEALKEMLITTADNARDLFIAQAEQKGLTAYQEIFTALTNESTNRKEELPFEEQGLQQGELPVE